VKAADVSGLGVVLRLLLLFLVSSPLLADTAIRFGVLSHRPDAQTMAQWQPLTEYLQVKLGREVVLSLHDERSLDAALTHHALDIVLSDPGLVITLQHHFGLSTALVTQVQARGQVQALGGVIFTRAHETGINTLADLSGRIVAATSKLSLGGYQAQALELLEAGLPRPDGARLLTTGMPHDLVVDAVLDGHADIGFVRSGVLEALIEEGRLEASQFKVITRQNLPAFPFMTSTRLYPEWPITVMPQVDQTLAGNIIVALLSLPSDSAAAHAAGIHGFAPPANYVGVDETLRRLRLPPYDIVPDFTLSDLWTKFSAWLIALAALALLAALSLVALILQNQFTRRKEGEYREQSRRLAEVIWGTNAGTWEWNVQSGETSFNERWAEIVGYTLDELSPVSIETWSSLAHPDDLKRSGEQLAACFDGRTDTYEYEARMRHKNGDWVWVQDRGRVAAWTDDGKPLRMSGTHLDITARKLAELNLELAASVFSHAREGITITDATGSIIKVNDAFTRITGYSREEVLGQNPRILQSGRQGPDFYANLWANIGKKGHWSGEVWNQRKNGEIYAEMLTISAVRDTDGHIEHYVALFTDITPLKNQQQQLERIAHFDALTNLPNRVLLADRLQQAMAQSQRNSTQLAVAYLDLDGFKAVNDLHGHDVGDDLLIAVTQRMKAALRDGDTLARLGGDEFVIVMVGLEQSEHCEPVLSRLLEAVAAPVQVGSAMLRVSASIGVTLYPQDGVDAEQLLRHADQAMYQAKQAGKNRYHLFDIDQDAAVNTQREHLAHIGRALEHSEFVLHYQPKVNMRTGALVGVEALIRWQHPERGLLSPAAFLPAIEDHAVSVAVGEWVIDTALAQAAEWQHIGLNIPISVNVGAKQLQQIDFVARLASALKRHPTLPASALELEVLETSALADIAHISGVMRATRQLGVHFALDDFGTGYSSLTYLRRLPADILKIDRSFVSDMLDDTEDLAIVEGVIGLARAFRCDVIAEGVETIAHGELLLALGCELAQGFGISRPLPAAEIPAWVATWQPDAAWTQWHNRTSNDNEMVIAFAEVAHRHWLKAFVNYLDGKLESPPPMDQDKIQFGRRFDSHYQAQLHMHSAFPVLLDLHQRTNKLGKSLVVLHRQGRTDEARSLLHELFGLRNELLTQLRDLVMGVDSKIKAT